MGRRNKNCGRREASDSEDEVADIARAIELENALSRRFTVNVSKGRRASKRVRYEEEDDQLVQKMRGAIVIGGKEVAIDHLADAVNNLIGSSIRTEGDGELSI